MAAPQTPPSAPVRALPAPQASKPRSAQRPTAPMTDIGATPFWAGLCASGAWIFLIVLIVARSGPAHDFAGLPLVDWAIGISAIVSPIALIWMVAAYLQRASDMQSVAEPLRRQLSMITGESGAAEARIRRFNQAIREQVELLKSAQSMSQSDFAAIMDRAKKHRDDLERFEHSSIHQVKEIQEIVRRNMQQVENLMEDKFTMMRVLDDRLVQSGDSVGRQAESVREQVAALLSEIESHTQKVGETLERASQDSQKLADTSHAQGSSLTAAAESAAEILNGLSGKIDLSVARFLERAGTAREEAQHLAVTLDTQTRALDEFSSTLPVRVSEAEAVIRGVADRLYASEQMAREQAVHLSEKLSTQVDSLQQFMDRFTAQLTGVDQSLSQRRDDLDLLAGRINETTKGFTQAWEKSILDLSERTNGALTRFTAIGSETRKGAESVSTQLAETTVKYEAAALRMHRMSDESASQMKGIGAAIDAQLAKFEALRDASGKAGEEVQLRAGRATENLQHILERLLAAREATQSVGETLIKDLYAAADRNEVLIGRLSEAAQTSVRTLGAAGDVLSRQETEMADRTRATEAALREATLQLQQGTVSAEQNLQAVARYDQGLQEQLVKLQQFHARVGGMSEDLGRTTAETVSGIEQLNGRFIAVRTVQEETARKTLEQFADLSDRLQREIEGLTGNSDKASSTLQQAAARFGEQSYQILQNAETSGAKLQLITSALQNEAAQIRANLERQSGELDRVALHYNETARAAAQDLEMRAERLEQTTGKTQDRAEALNVVLAQQMNLLNDGAAKLEAGTSQIGNSSGKALQQLSALSEKFMLVHEAANTNVQQTLQRLEECNTAFFRQNTTLSEAAQTAANLVQKAGTAFGEQAGKVFDNTHQMDQSLRQLTATTSTLAEQSAQVRAAMEQQNQRLVAQLTDALSQMEAAGARFERTAANTADGASNAETNLTSLSAGIGQQAITLAAISEQISGQYRALVTAGETQRVQLVDLFDKLGAAHSQASEVAERTIARLSESLSQIHARLGALGDQSQAAVGHVKTASTSFADQSSLLLQNAQAAEQQARTVLSVTAALQDQARQLREALYGEGERAGELLGSLLTKLSSGSIDVREVASATEMSLTSLQNNMTQQTQGLNTAMQQLSDRQRTLTTALDAQRDVLNGLLSRLGLAQDETAAIAERTAARITDSAQQVTRQAEAMGAQAQNALSSIHAAASSFAEEAGTLGMQAQQAEQQMRGVLSVTAGMQEQARQLREAMQSETARVIEQLNAALAQLDVAGNQLKLQNGAAMHSMDQTVLQFAALTKTGADAMQRQAEIMDRSGEKLSTHIKLVNEAGAITEGQANRLGDAAARVAEIKSALQGELTRLNDLSERAIRQVLDASQELAGKSDTLRANLAASESALQQAATLVRDESVQMPATLDRSTAQIEAASRVLKAQAGETDGMLIGVADRFIAVTTTARNSMTEEMRRIGAVAEEADKVLRHFNTGLTEQVGSMRQSAAVLSSEQKELVTRAHDSVAQLAAASERLGQLRSDAVATAERLGQHFDNLDQRATAASERLTETAEVAAKQMDVLAEATKRADGQMPSASNQFREQFERIRAGLQGQIDDINRGLMQITAQLERTALPCVQPPPAPWPMSSVSPSASTRPAAKRGRNWRRRPRACAAPLKRWRSFWAASAIRSTCCWTGLRWRATASAGTKAILSISCRPRSRISAASPNGSRPAGRWPPMSANRRPPASMTWSRPFSTRCKAWLPARRRRPACCAVWARSTAIRRRRSTAASRNTDRDAGDEQLDRRNAAKSGPHARVAQAAGRRADDLAARYSAAARQRRRSAQRSVGRSGTKEERGLTSVMPAQADIYLSFQKGNGPQIFSATWHQSSFVRLPHKLWHFKWLRLVMGQSLAS